VDREAFWKAVRGVGVPETIVSLIRDLHSHTHSQVRVANSLSLPFGTHSGVRQGCVLAPALFCRPVDWVLEKSMLHTGAEISGHRLSDIDYTDDIATLDTDPVSLAATLTNMESSCCVLGLYISWTQTKVKNIGAGPPAQTIMVNGQKVEGVENFTYHSFTLR